MSDSRELAERADGGGAVAKHESRSDNFLTMLLEAARDPSIDAAKVKTMADLAIQLQDRERETQFAQDFAAALMEMPYISKRGVIVIPAKDGRPEREQGKFATFEDLDKVVRPILARHNMVISFKLGSDQGTTATPILTHTNGYRDIGDALKVPPDTSGSKNAAQAIGSSSSYAKRYAMCACLNIVTVGEDDDGRGYPLPDDPLSSRQERLVAEAEASFADGNYPAWYAKQTPKDRAWLVIRGVHARCGGPALPAPDPQTASSPPPPAQKDATGGELALEPPAGPKAKKTPRQWVDGFKSDLLKVADADALDAYMLGKQDSLARLRESDEALSKECDQAYRNRLADFLEV